VQALELYAPVHRFNLLIRRRKGERQVRLDWHALVKAAEPLLCEAGSGLRGGKKKPRRGNGRGSGDLQRGLEGHLDARRSEEGRRRTASLLDSNIRNEQPIGHPLLKMPDHMRLAS
jgi:hypothetical protein